MHREFAAAAIEHNTAVEINIGANLLNKGYPDTFAPCYIEYLAELQSQGVRLSIGSDCHSAHYEAGFEQVGRMLENDLVHSKRTGSDVLADRPFWFRLGVRLSRMLAPIQ